MTNILLPGVLMAVELYLLYKIVKISVEGKEERVYTYPVENMGRSTNIKNMYHALLDMPTRVRKIVQKMPVTYLFGFFIVFILSMQFRLVPDMMSLGNNTPFYKSALYGTFLFVGLYVVLYIWHKKAYWYTLPIGAIGFMFSLFIVVPLLLNGYYIAFELSKKPFSHEVTAYYCYYVEYDTDEHNYTSKYGWFDIKNKDNTAWNYDAYLEAHKPLEKYSETLYDFIEVQTDNKDIEKYADITQKNCEVYPCKIVTPYDVKADLQIVGYEAFGEVLVDEMTVKNKRLQPSFVDSYTVSVIKHKRDYSEDMIIVSIAKEFSYKIGDTIAVLSGMGVAIDRNISEMKKILLSSNYDGDTSYDLLHLSEDNFFLNKEDIPRYLKDFRNNNVRKPLVLLSPLYFIPLKAKGEPSVSEKDLKKYNYYNVLYEGSVFDEKIGFYTIKYSLVKEK